MEQEQIVVENPSIKEVVAYNNITTWLTISPEPFVSASMHQQLVHAEMLEINYEVERAENTPYLVYRAWVNGLAV